MTKNENKDIRADDTPAGETAARELTDAELEHAAGGVGNHVECTKCKRLALERLIIDGLCPRCRE